MQPHLLNFFTILLLILLGSDKIRNVENTKFLIFP
jgi:hypothetical protein